MRRTIAGLAMAVLGLTTLGQEATAEDPMLRITGDVVADGVSFARESEGMYGGAWIDHDPERFTVAVTSEADDAYVAGIRARLPAWVTVRIVVVDDTERDLLQVYRAASEQMAAENEEGGITSVRVRERQNLVEVGIAPEDFNRLQATVTSALSGVDVNVVAKKPDEPMTCTRTDCNNSPWKAGIRIDMPDQGADADGPCTSGFIAYRPNSSDGPAYRMITAGHCGYDGPGTTLGDTWYHDLSHTILIGDVTHTRYTGETAADAQLIDIASGREGHKYLKGDDNAVAVAAIMARDDTVVGSDVCLSAYNQYMDTSGRRCGEVTDRWYTTSYHSGVTLVNQMLADYTTDHGDSGGPVMGRWSETAVGIHSGVTSGEHEAIFSHITGFLNEYPAYTLCTSGDAFTGC